MADAGGCSTRRGGRSPARRSVGAGRVPGGARCSTLRRRAHRRRRPLPLHAARARGPSRQLFVTYRSHLGDPDAGGRAVLALKVAAGVRLVVRPRHVRNGQAITFRGALLGRPIPASGKLIDMQVKVGRRWQTFATTRARGRRASFDYRYRFTRTTARIIYRFRALARAESAYPYATGASRIVKVRVN